MSLVQYRFENVFQLNHFDFPKDLLRHYLIIVHQAIHDQQYLFIQNYFQHNPYQLQVKLTEFQINIFDLI
jgi:hypothetical protein